MKEASRYAKTIGCHGARIYGEWNGYKVFNPWFRTPVDIGMPFYILYKNGAFSIMHDNEIVQEIYKELSRQKNIKRKLDAGK